MLENNLCIHEVGEIVMLGGGKGWYYGCMLSKLCSMWL